MYDGGGKRFDTRRETGSTCEGERSGGRHQTWRVQMYKRCRQIEVADHISILCLDSSWICIGSQEGRILGYCFLRATNAFNEPPLLGSGATKIDNGRSGYRRSRCGCVMFAYRRRVPPDLCFKSMPVHPRSITNKCQPTHAQRTDSRNRAENQTGSQCQTKRKPPSFARVLRESGVRARPTHARGSVTLTWSCLQSSKPGRHTMERYSAW